MKYSHIAFVFIALLLAVLSACTLPTATPAPSGMVGYNPNKVILLPTATPMAIPPNSPLFGACIPPALSLNSANGWCANHTSKTGGVTINMSGELGIDYTNNVGVSCTGVQGKFICTGPQNASFPISTCTWCGGGVPYGQKVDPSKDFGDYTCSIGYSKDPTTGICKPDKGRYPDGACPTGSHFDNSQQWCVDDATNQKVANLCSPGTVAYLPSFQSCLLKPLPTPMEFNCQTWTITLGDCTTQKSTGGAPPAKNCPLGSTNTCK